MASQLRVFGNGDVEGSRASLTFCASVSPFVRSLQGAVRHQNDEKKAVVWRNRMSWDQCLSKITAELAVEDTGKVLAGAAEPQNCQVLQRRHPG